MLLCIWSECGEYNHAASEEEGSCVILPDGDALDPSMVCGSSRLQWRVPNAAIAAVALPASSTCLCVHCTPHLVVPKARYFLDSRVHSY
jgi:hypothetical protein